MAERNETVKLSVDHILTGLAAAAVGGGALALSAHSSVSNTGADTSFTKSDEAVFDRGFQLADRACDVGYAAQKLCFEHSPLERRIVEGEPFPETVYPLALEWRANLALDRKVPELKTVRIGQTIALMDRDTRMVVDKLELAPVQQAETDATPAG
jgi:hypothetical protein